MNTDELMRDAESTAMNLYDGPQDNKEGLMCAQISALLAIANELKRVGDLIESVQTLAFMTEDADGLPDKEFMAIRTWSYAAHLER